MDKPITKAEAFISTLLDVGQNGITALEAINGNGHYWSSCLHTDVSLLNNKYGVRLARKVEMFERKQGNKVPFTRYWVGSVEDAEKLTKALNHLRTKREVEELPASMLSGMVSRFKGEVTTQN